jgi:rsbT co-antagonist protein RsbR
MMMNSQLVQMFEVSEDDLELVQKLGSLVSPRIDEFIEKLYTYFGVMLGPDFEIHFPDEDTLARAQAHMRRGWLEFFEGRWDEEYLRSRERVGEVHAQLQVEPRHYLAAMIKSTDLLTIDLIPTDLSVDDRHAMANAVRKVALMEAALVVDVYSRRTAEVIAQQSRALVDMSTPIAALWEGILMLPIVGILDSCRAQDIMQRMLEQVAEKEAVVFILDISGVAVVDTAVANHLIRMTKAARLMGCETIVSGLSPSVAQTIVELGIDVGEMRTTGNLRDALREAFDRVGVDHGQ